jgi:hypothetical protein
MGLRTWSTGGYDANRGSNRLGRDLLVLLADGGYRPKQRRTLLHSIHIGFGYGFSLHFDLGRAWQSVAQMILLATAFGSSR